MTSDLTQIPSGMSVDQILQQKMRVAELMERVLKEGEHYGIIEGTKKKTLYKSGAETIALTFGIHPRLEVERIELEGGHREYQVKCLMFRNSDEMALASGVGSCSSMESKYRWRKRKRYDMETKKQVEEKIENPNLQDIFNTVLKMAKKRAFVDAVITATAASDFVTQDLEDLQDALPPKEKAPWEDEIALINDLEALQSYLKANEGKGADFVACIIARKKEIEKTLTPMQ